MRIKYQPTVPNSLNSSLTLDFSNSSSDVQDVNTLLQNLLDRFYPSIKYLFDNGNQYTDITGGWSGDGYKDSSATTSKSGSITDDCLYVVGASSTASIIGTVNKIDLSNYNILKFSVKASSIEGTEGGFMKVVDSKTFSIVDSNNRLIVMENGTFELNVTDLQGEYYILFDVQNTSKRYLKISKVWLE